MGQNPYVLCQTYDVVVAEWVACKKLQIAAQVKAIHALRRRVRAAAASSFSSG
jgi:hypothetical protein